MKEERLLKKLTRQGLGSVWVFLAMVSVSALVALNSTVVYRFVVEVYDLSSLTGLTTQALMENYRQIVVYLQWPWRGELQLSDFSMSETGRIHFEEVRRIFQALYLIVVLFLITWGLAIKKKIAMLPVFNSGANLVLIVSGLLALLMSLDFSQAFIWFHQLFFNNDYWIFNASTDPVILALPEQLFLILGAVVIAILFGQCVLIKGLTFKNKRR